MKIGLIAERKNPPDKRVVLNPETCKKAMELFPELEIKAEGIHPRRLGDRQGTGSAADSPAGRARRRTVHRRQLRRNPVGTDGE